MLNEEIVGRWHHLKENMQHYWSKLSDKKKMPLPIHIDNHHYESHRVDDLELTMNKDPGPGIKYGYTDNSEYARGAEKVAARGIDHFGEEDSFDPDEDRNLH